MVALRRPFCSEYSRSVGDQLQGSAKLADTWLLIEHRGTWERDALLGLPDLVRDRLKSLQHAQSAIKVILIRRSDARDTTPLNVFRASSNGSCHKLAHFQIDTYTDLLSVDPLTHGKECQNQSLFAVCTHAKHDLCCGKFGNAIYRALKNISPNNVWQASHLGGCRFAPNLLVLPFGLIYGWIDLSEVKEIAEVHQRRDLYLPKLRGRSSYEPQTQAAEYHIRAKTQNLEIDGLSLLSEAGTGPDDWTTVFKMAQSNCLYQVRVYIDQPGISTFKSCSATQPTSRKHFRCEDGSET